MKGKVVRPACAAWFGDGGTNKKAGGRAGGGRAEDVQIFIGSDQGGLD